MLLCAMPAAAQSVDISLMEKCAALSTPDLKLDCFEAIMSSSKIPETPELDAIDLPESQPPVAEIEAAPEAQPPAEVMRQETPAVDAATDSTPAAVATSTVAVTVTTEPPAATVTTTPEPLASSQLGAAHLDRPEADKKANEDEVFQATVNEVTRGHNRILYFHFDNGRFLSLNRRSRKSKRRRRRSRPPK